MTQSAQTPEVRTAPQNGPRAPEVGARPLAVQSYGLTERGRHRETNEDQFVTATLMKALWIQQSSVPQWTVHYANDRGYVFIVADGMGGARAGEEASALAVGAIEGFLLNALRWLFALDGSADASVLREFKAALQNADAYVCAAAASNPDLRGMGTTLTMAYNSGADLFVAHAGDSRCYLLRRGALHRLTHDDTLMNQMVEGGLMTPEKSVNPDFRNIITNVVGGTTAGVRAEVHRVKLETGDVLLLCTDGLTSMVADERITSVLASSTSPQGACVELVRIANESGGKDNITVVVAQFI